METTSRDQPRDGHDREDDEEGDSRAVAERYGALWDLVRQGETAADAAGAHFPYGPLLAIGEWRIGRIILARIVPPLFAPDEAVYPAVVDLAQALLRAEDDADGARSAAERLHRTVMLSPSQFARPYQLLLRSFIDCGKHAPDPVHRLPAIQYVCSLFAWPEMAPERIEEWTPALHITVAHALRDALHPPGQQSDQVASHKEALPTATGRR